MAWVGSYDILKQFYETRQPVKYGQCWVFSGVTTTGEQLKITFYLIQADEDNNFSSRWIFNPGQFIAFVIYHSYPTFLQISFNVVIHGTVILEVNSEQVDTEYLSSSNIFIESHPAAPHSYRS